MKQRVVSEFVASLHWPGCSLDVASPRRHRPHQGSGATAAPAPAPTKAAEPAKGQHRLLQRPLRRRLRSPRLTGRKRPGITLIVPRRGRATDWSPD